MACSDAKRDLSEIMGLQAETNWTPPSMQLPDGDFELLESLGHGGMGVVYLAVDKKDRFVESNGIVIKFIRNAELARDPILVDQFRAEASAGIHLDHMCTARTFMFLDLREHVCNGWPAAALVMPRYEPSLLTVLNEFHGQLPVDLALNWAHNLVEAVEVIHTKGYVHRDIKPSNIFFRRSSTSEYVGLESLADSTAVLGDFGVICAAGKKPSFALKQDQWKAPELFDELDNPLPQLCAAPAEDIYALGLVLRSLNQALHTPQPWLEELSRECTDNDSMRRPKANDELRRRVAPDWYRAALSVSNALLGRHSLAKHYDLMPAARALAEWLNMIIQDSQWLVVGVVGEFKSGKSRLVNALLKREAAFVRDVEATLIASEYYPSTGNSDFVVLSRDGRQEQINLSRYLTLCREGTIREYDQADVYLQSGVDYVLIDTPGMGTINAESDQRAEAIVKKADVIIWTIDPINPSSAKQGTFLRRARDIGLPVLPVVTKADLFREENMAKLTRRLADDVHYPIDEFCAVSADKELREGIEPGIDPGIKSLRGKLAQLVASRKSVRQRSRIAKQKEIVEESVRIVADLQTRLVADSKWIEAERRLIESQGQSVKTRLHDVCRLGVGERVRIFLSSRLPESMDQHELPSVLDTIFDQLVMELPMIKQEIIQLAQSQARIGWTLILDRNTRDLERQIADLMERQVEHGETIAFLKEQLHRVAFRREIVVDTIETSRTSPGVWATLLAVGAAIGAVVSTSPWGRLIAAGLALLFGGGNGETTRSVTTAEREVLRFQRDRMIELLSNELGVLIESGISGSIDRYVDAIVDSTLARMCHDKFGGRTIEQINGARHTIEQLTCQLDAVQWILDENTRK